MYTFLLLLHSAAWVQGLNYDDLLEDFPLVVTTSTRDGDLMEDPATFVSDGGVRRGVRRGAGGGARRYHKYILKEDRVYKDKIMDLMKQVLYAAQDHMGELAPTLDKYRGDPGFRMRFILNRLQQYTVDMRRIYTLAVRGGTSVRVSDHIRLYQHLARKHVDVIYVVDHVIAAHERYMELELQRRENIDQDRDRQPPVDEITGDTPDIEAVKAHLQQRGELPPGGGVPPGGGLPPGGGVPTPPSGGLPTY